ncbi:MAG: AAA family ATPase, partial [Archangium sp.]|nr:AAA family ATPase [Archangium sp.]
DFDALERRGATIEYVASHDISWFSLVNGVLLVVLLWMLAIAWKNLKPQGTDPMKFTPTLEVARSPSGTMPQGARDSLKQVVAAVRAGADGPRRVLIVGPPGSGKTQLLHALSADAQLPSVITPGSRIIEIFLGIGAGRLRKIFEVAAANQPCAVAFDDVDAFASVRQLSDEHGKTDERTQTLLELNTCLDGLAPNVMVVLTTSREDLLDPTLVRPGRIQRVVRLDGQGGCVVEDR